MINMQDGHNFMEDYSSLESKEHHIWYHNQNEHRPITYSKWQSNLYPSNPLKPNKMSKSLSGSEMDMIVNNA